MAGDGASKSRCIEVAGNHVATDRPRREAANAVEFQKCETESPSRVSAFTQPIVVEGDHRVRLLERLPLSQGNQGQFSEAWLQHALFKAPSCLPVREIDPHSGDLIPVCKELETGAGPADILYVTKTGQIVLVETKLWRNPEARRAVLAQILDYAKELSGWTFADLQRQVAAATKNGPGELLRCVRDAVQGLDEASFVDGINRSLRTGDFILLIVGDGIRSGAESLVGFIQQYGNLRFAIGLIEVAAYRLADDVVLLQPRILARTEVLTRVVLVGCDSQSQVSQEGALEREEAPSEAPDAAAWFQKFWSEFQAALVLDDQTQPLPKKLPRSTNYFFPMPPSAAQAWVSAYLSQSKGTAGVYLSFAKGFERAADFYEQLHAQREEIERSIGMPLNWHRDPDTGKIWISVEVHSYTNLDDSRERGRVIAALAHEANVMVNAFRHRLVDLNRSADSLLP